MNSNSVTCHSREKSQLFLSQQRNPVKEGPPHGWFVSVTVFLPPMFLLAAPVISRFRQFLASGFDSTFPLSILLLNHVSQIPIWTYFPAWNLSIVLTTWGPCSLGPPSMPPAFVSWIWCSCCIDSFVFPRDVRPFHKKGLRSWWFPHGVSWPFPCDDSLFFTTSSSVFSSPTGPGRLHHPQLGSFLHIP